MRGYIHYYFDTYILLYKNWQINNMCLQLKYYNFELSIAPNDKIIKIK